MPDLETRTAFVCDRCCHFQGHSPRVPADSRDSSWLCEVCGHYGIGSSYTCQVGDWDRLRIIATPKPVPPVILADCARHL